MLGLLDVCVKIICTWTSYIRKVTAAAKNRSKLRAWSYNNCVMELAAGLGAHTIGLSKHYHWLIAGILALSLAR